MLRDRLLIAPVGSAPVGSARSGSARSGSVPVGFAPVGFAPVGFAPVGSARRGALRVPLRALALCAALAACAAPGPPAPAARPAAPPDRDGAYYGTSTRFRAAARDCPHPGVITLYVAQGQFYYRWTYGTDILASIAPDGTLRGSGPGITLTGTVRGRRMDGNVTSAACGLHFTVTRHF